MTIYRSFISVLIVAFAGWTPVYSQFTSADYQKADSVDRFSKMVYHAFVSPNWVDESNLFWYDVKTREGTEYFLVDAEKTEKEAAFDQKRLAELLTDATNEAYEAYDLPIKDIEFNKTALEMTFVLDSVRYMLEKESYKLNRLEVLKPDRSDSRHWAEVDDERSVQTVGSPDSIWTAYVKDNNVYVKKQANGEEYQLSYDGSDGEYYSSNIRWSPNSEYLATNKIRPNKKRLIYIVESSPDDQLQPKLHEYEYMKPGDALQIMKPSLFHVQDKQQIAIDTQPFEHHFRLTTPKWWEDSRGFTFEFNQRGHQVYQVVEVYAENGQTRVLIDERSDTFIQYGAKKFRHDVDDGKEIIWMSERDGWNHLYLFDGSSGQLKHQITRGEWVVRKVEHVNDSLRTIIFSGSGRYPEEDPYLLHYYKINFDGSGLVELTPEIANHNATFSSDYSYFVDNYSRIDLPPVTVLRKSSDGQLLMEVERADITDLIGNSWQTPEVFSAKGRDGKTDIWGNIYRPTNFDPNKSYPIIEAIYAGPHSAHVPKSFRPFFGSFSSLAELGFIIVQIDGMGTSHRSKAFHDVCWKNLKDAGFPDRILWMQAAAKEYPYMDIERVGIFGGSAGGQNAMGALLFHSDFYKVAVSSVGCHDNRMDKIWWNEQWMGYPIGTQYAESSNVDNAHKLQGKLLLTVGELDTNVDPASTMQVVNALIEAGKDFEFLVFPGQGHGSGGKYGERKKKDFFVKHLLMKDTPDWNLVEME